MIEMRWLVPVEGTKVLQYRQQYDATISAQVPDMITWFNGPATNMQWSEWRDVPLVAERDPSYP
jgi:hypothetical protein